MRISRVISSTFEGSGRHYSTLLNLDSRNMGMVELEHGTGRAVDSATNSQTTVGRRLVSAEECAESSLYRIADETARMPSFSGNDSWQSETSVLNDGYQSLRRWLWPGEPNDDNNMLMAVPKRKVTPHRKGNRSATKFIRFVPIVSQCSKCQKVFPQHAMPSKCDEEECPAFNVRRNPQK